MRLIKKFLIFVFCFLLLLLSVSSVSAASYDTSQHVCSDGTYIDDTTYNTLFNMINQNDYGYEYYIVTRFKTGGVYNYNFKFFNEEVYYIKKDNKSFIYFPSDYTVWLDQRFKVLAVGNHHYDGFQLVEDKCIVYSNHNILNKDDNRIFFAAGKGLNLSFDDDIIDDDIIDDEIEDYRDDNTLISSLTDIVIDEFNSENTEEWGVIDWIKNLFLFVFKLPFLIFNIFLKFFNPLFKWIIYLVKYSFIDCVNIAKNPKLIGQYILQLPELFKDTLSLVFATQFELLKSIKDNILDVPDFLKSIYNSIFNMPDEVKNIIKYIVQLQDNLVNFLKGIPDFFVNILDKITNFGDIIFNAIKRFFVPDEIELKKSLDSFVNVLKTSFGVEAYDLSDVFGVSTKISDIKLTLPVWGQDITFTVVDVDYIVKAVTTFRPYIRGFITLSLVFYNINSFLGLIGQQTIHFGSYTTNNVENTSIILKD